MTKEALVDALKTAVGGTAYGDMLVDEAAETYGDKDKKYGQDMKDRLDERLGVLKAYERIHRNAGAYGDMLVDEAAETYGDKDKKYGQDMKDRLDERLGVLKAYERIHRNAGAEAKATAEAEKIAIVEKALAALK